MATSANYYLDINTPKDALRELPGRMERIAATAKLLRDEINRVRNTALANKVPVPRGILTTLRHLQYDLCALRVEMLYWRGTDPAELTAAEADLIDPFRQTDNADHPAERDRH